MNLQTKKLIIDKALKQNLNIHKNQLQWRIDGRLEGVCKHGIGHTVYSPCKDEYAFVHGCDNCCQDINIINE